MKHRENFDVMRDLLDHELIDCNGISCGMVDDVEFSSSEDRVGIVALWVGPGAWESRLPAFLRIIVRAVARGRRRIDFGEVVQISEVVRLRSTATVLRLGIADRKAGRWLQRWERK